MYFLALRLLRVLFAFQYLRIFSRNFLGVRDSQINSLWSKNILHIISVFLDILEFILWAILMNVLCLLKRNGVFCCWGIMPYKCQVSQLCWYCGSNKSSISLLIFVYLLTSNVTLDLTVSHFSFASFFTCFFSL